MQFIFLAVTSNFALCFHGRFGGALSQTVPSEVTSALKIMTSLQMSDYDVSVFYAAEICS